MRPFIQKSGRKEGRKEGRKRNKKLKLRKVEAHGEY
jgi:hypothetical protein